MPLLMAGDDPEETDDDLKILEAGEFHTPPCAHPTVA